MDGWMDWLIDWLAACQAADATAAGCCVSLPKQLSALRTFYLGILKAMLKKTWDSASLRTETLRENMGQCKSEGQDFKRE
jgi:hypothetical protein